MDVKSKDRHPYHKEMIHRGQGHVKAEGNTGELHLQANQCQGSPEVTHSWEEARNDSSLEPLMGELCY